MTYHEYPPHPRLLPFVKPIYSLEGKLDADLSDVAYTSDYADQAHFIHDFQEFSGLTPGAFLRSENVFF